MALLRILLYPFALVYGSVVFLRNRLFDWKIMPSAKAPVRTIVVGNLALGGTGKTPHTEFLVRYLSVKKKIAVLSRGYGRKSKGFVMAGPHSRATDIGDEPMQIHLKFPDVPVAVCEDRHKGISELLKKIPELDLVILDDAFQHRSLTADLNILLTSFYMPYWKDCMLPTGTLRDNKKERSRADIIIITKCPETLTTEEMGVYKRKARARDDQQVFFTTADYKEPIPATGPVRSINDVQALSGFAGIANSNSFLGYLHEHFPLKKFKNYPDHHNYTTADIEFLRSELSNFVGLSSALVTTEKDAARLYGMPGIMETPLFYVPIETRFLVDEVEFMKKIESVI